MSQKPNEMTIWMHLDELRKHLLHSIIYLIIGVTITTIFANTLLEILAKPIGGFEQLLSIQVTENIGVYFRVSMLGGFILALPFMFIRIFLFVKPGLTNKEQKWLIWAVPTATILFLLGALFAYFVTLPTALPFLVTFPGPNVLPKWKDYINFVTNIIFWVGISFEAPLLMYILARLGIVDGITLLKQWRIALIIIAIIAAVATPTPDPINMAILMLPLFLLYAFGIILAFFAKQK